ncbi:MAG: O-antigen ligase family protein [Bacteroidales bacterium]|jgi:hypothetical protein|nr:O-antigen ligase family protein [Bacteroidales bacterium]
MTEKNKSQTSIPTWQVCTMFLIPFYGILCIVWFVYLLFGYPCWSFGGVDITAINISRRIEIIATLFFIYIIVSQYKIGGIQQFSGFSIPIAIMLLMLTCRQVADMWFLWDYPIQRILVRLTFPIMLLTFTLPINRDSYRKGFYWIYIVLFILSIIIIVTWYDWIGNGLTMRSPSMKTAEYKTYDSFYFGTIAHSKQLTGGGGHVYLVGFIGSLLAALSLYRLLQNRHTIYQIQIGLIIGYALGCMLVFFAGYKSIVLGLASAGLFFICTSKFWQSWKTTIKIVLLLFLGSLLFFTIGYKDNNSISKRFIEFYDTLRPNTQQLLNKKIGDILIAEPQSVEVHTPISKSSPKSNSELVTSQSEFFIKNPYTLKTKPTFGRDDKYRMVNQKMNISDARVALYLMGVKVILDNPILGYGTCLYVNINNQPTTISMHCNVLIIFLATGIVGGILFLYIIIRCCIDLFIIMSHIPECGWLPGIFLLAFIANITGTSCIEYAPLWVPLVAMRTCVKTQYKFCGQRKEAI